MWNDGWVALPGNGQVTGLNFNDVAIGLDNMSMYKWNINTGWTQLDWDHWQLLQLGSTISQGFVEQITEVAVGLEHSIWVKGPLRGFP